MVEKGTQQPILERLEGGDPEIKTTNERRIKDRLEQLTLAINQGPGCSEELLVHSGRSLAKAGCRVTIIIRQLISRAVTEIRRGSGGQIRCQSNLREDVGLYVTVMGIFLDRREECEPQVRVRVGYRNFTSNVFFLPDYSDQHEGIVLYAVFPSASLPTLGGDISHER